MINDTTLVCVTFNLQKGITPFRLAVEKERSKIVKYFVEEIKVDTTLYDQVIIKLHVHTYIHISDFEQSPAVAIANYFLFV